MRRLALAIGLALGVVGVAQAGSPTESGAVCPINGKKFTFWTTASYSKWAYGLDGKPEGSWDFPLALPQCPDSKFPALENLPPDELAKAKAMVETAEYKAIAGEQSYYVLYWVMRRLGRKPDDYAYALLQATWQARGDKAAYERYVRELIPILDDLVATLKPDVEGWWTVQMYAVNLLRQSGDFPAAQARLDEAMKQSATMPAGKTERFKITAELIAAKDARDYVPQPPWRKKLLDEQEKKRQQAEKPPAS